MNNETRVTVYGENSPSIPEGVQEFMEYWADKIARIPEEYRDIARIRLDSHVDEHGVSVEIAYYRPESEEDRQERQRFEEEQAAERVRRDLANLKSLKEKYPDN